MDNELSKVIELLENMSVDKRLYEFGEGDILQILKTHTLIYICGVLFEYYSIKY